MSQTHCPDCHKYSCICRLEFMSWPAWAWQYIRRLGGRRP